MSAIGRRIVERAPKVPRLGGEAQLVQDGLTFLDEAIPVVATVHHQERAGAVMARRSQVYVRWFDDDGIAHLGWLPENAVREADDNCTACYTGEPNDEHTCLLALRTGT